jgi:predicted RNA-binding protein YlxR (DUF448 family)
LRNSADPHRQCIGCRSVRPKKELIRLVLLPSGQTVFDGTHTGQGRGIYLCPDGMCFQRAYKNKRWIKYFHDNTYLRELFDGILDTLLGSIKRYFALGIKMKLLRDTHMELDHLSREDLIVVGREMSPDQKKKILSAAHKKNAAVMDVPGNCMQAAATHVVKEGFPLITRLKRDLRMYERLSSKGLAI